jgi:ABC-2 type transport system permease protein
MQRYRALMRRELAGFFLSMRGYVILAAVAFLTACGLVLMLINLQGEPTSVPVTELFYQTAFFWVILLPAVPLITMRLFSLEKFSGTFETLMTTPVTDAQVVAAKFSAALLFYMVMWLPLLGCILVLHRFGGHSHPLDWGVLGSTFLGIGLLGCPFLAFGCLASSLTRSQVAAAMLSLMFTLGLFFLSFLPERLFSGRNWISQVGAVFALRDQVQDFVRGVVDTRPVVLYLSLTFFFLFLTLRVLGSRRWK